MKKSTAVQELVNLYPPWSRVRTDDQSVGYQLYSTLAKPIEDMDRQLEHMRRNEFLSTVNLNEIDLTYRVALPNTFEFDVDNIDPTNPIPQPPTVEGMVFTDTSSGYMSISIADNEDIRSFWHDSIPNRITTETTASGAFQLLTQSVNDFPWSGMLYHHLGIEDQGGGRIWIEVDGGTQYVKKNDRNEVERGRIVLKGITRKGTEEEETIVFPWDEKQPSLKEWKILTDINAHDMESGVNVSIRSADFNSPPYWSFYNSRVSNNRTKVDEFWDVDSSLLQRVGLIAEDWQQALLGFSDREVKEEWELLDKDWNLLTNVQDIAVEPFTNNGWVITLDRQLYCYSLDEIMVSGLSHLRDKSEGPEAQLEIENKHITTNDDIVFTPWHARPLKEIVRWRVWYVDPNEDKWTINSDGTIIAFDDSLWEVGRSIKRVIANQMTISSLIRGEYLLALDAEYIDGSSDADRAIVSVQYKLPLTHIDLADSISDDCLGIDFDSDQKLWIRTAQTYYQLNLHSDKMLIDYANKIIYLRELYDDVKVTT